jgi:hypothetical protein
MSGSDRARPNRLRRWYGEYLSSLKAVEAEEALDLVLYRPLAFVLTKLLLRTSATPNQVSVASLACGVLAGFAFSVGTPRAWTLAALAYFACNTLDCADGQLARLRGGGTPLGYMVDGCIDYAASVAIFAGLARGLELRQPGALSWFWVCAVAGPCYAWHCAILDQKRKEWMHWVYGKRIDGGHELRILKAQALAYRREGGHWVERILIGAYATYHAGWSRLVPERRLPERSPAQIEAWAKRNRPVLRLATWMGPTTQMSLIMLSALGRRPDWFLWGTLTLGNAFALRVLLAQRKASCAHEHAAADARPHAGAA